VTPDQLALLEDTIDALATRGDEITTCFYDRLFARLPEVRALFPDDLTDQREKFFSTLTEIARSLRHLERVTEPAHELGARHRTYGVVSGHYPVVGEVLVGALGEVLGEWFTDAHREAWTKGYDLVAELMQQGGRPTPERPRLGDRRRPPG
jgi:hemoglobin-like flavoprotein